MARGSLIVRRALRAPLFAVAGSVLAFGPLTAQAQILAPTPYQGFSASSPFAAVGFSSFFLENFEDGAFNTPSATPSAGWVVPTGILDSVDEDDGVLNGTGASGRSYYSAGTQTSLTINFSLINGSLPTHAGIVWTDVGQIIGAGGLARGDVIFEAFDGASVSIGTFGPILLGDGLISGETSEDRFFGAINLGGISSIRISMPSSVDWEVDHVQYGVIIPAPGALAMTLVAGAIASRRRRD
ncbi:MAG: hypothetical protein K2X32_02965 [Phycisphaerales bacterium]|nr:hypothetical protein [Phycisphaerales bacterium]